MMPIIRASAFFHKKIRTLRQRHTLRGAREILATEKWRIRTLSFRRDTVDDRIILSSGPLLRKGKMSPTISKEHIMVDFDIGTAMAIEQLILGMMEIAAKIEAGLILIGNSSSIARIITPVNNRAIFILYNAAERISPDQFWFMVGMRETPAMVTMCAHDNVTLLTAYDILESLSEPLDSDYFSRPTYSRGNCAEEMLVLNSHRAHQLLWSARQGEPAREPLLMALHSSPRASVSRHEPTSQYENPDIRNHDQVTPFLIGPKVGSSHIASAILGLLRSHARYLPEYVRIDQIGKFKNYMERI